MSEEITYDLGSYGLAVRNAVRGAWSGVFDETDFVIVMMDLIYRGLHLAWYSGAAECGIGRDELSVEELTALDLQISTQYDHLYGFADFIIRNRKADGGKLGLCLSRAEMWTNAYTETRNLAKQMACKDQRLVWVRNPLAESCIDCLRLDGKVKRASQWAAADIRPQHRDLACHGYRCKCDLIPTKEPMSKGPLPKLVGR